MAFAVACCDRRAYVDFGVRGYVRAFESGDPALAGPHSQRKSKRGDELCVVADFRMDIEREMRAVKRHVSFESELKLPAQRARHRL